MSSPTMANKGFQGIFKEGYVKDRILRRSINVFVQNTFSLGQILLFGAVIQLAVLGLLPTKYALLPTLLLLLHTIVTTALQVSSPARNPFQADVVPGKTSAQLPQASYDPRITTPFGSKPASRGLVILHLGVRFHHPLGVLAPGARELGAHSAACNKRVLDRATDFGCLGASSWTANEGKTHNTLLTVFYFRDMEGLHAFAHDKVHRDAWTWYHKEFMAAGATHIGVFHEAFYAAPGAYETVYINMPPTLLGKANASSLNEETGVEESHPTLVDAETPLLRSQWRRMGKTVKQENDEYYVPEIKAQA